MQARTQHSETTGLNIADRSEAIDEGCLFNAPVA